LAGGNQSGYARPDHNDTARVEGDGGELLVYSKVNVAVSL